MSRVNTLSVSWSVLDGDEPRHWTIWQLTFDEVERIVRGTAGDIPPFPTRSEFFLLDQTQEQLFQRDSWMSVVGTIVHVTEETRLQRLRAAHRKICHYLKAEAGALYREVGYYILLVAEPSIWKNTDLRSQTTDFLVDAKYALGNVVELTPRAECERDFTNSLKYVAERMVLLRETASST